METDATKEELQRLEFMRQKKIQASRPDGLSVRFADDNRRQRGSGGASEGDSNSSDMNISDMSDDDDEVSSDSNEYSSDDE